MQRTLTDKATPAEAAELQHTLERGYQRAYQAAREADPWGSDYQARFQTAAECNEVAADVVHETLENGMRRLAESTADFLSRTRAEAQATTAKQGGFQTADQIIRAQADAGMTPDAIDRHQEEVAASLLSDAKTADGQAFAREYADTAATYVRDLKELDEPGLTPGAPHPDPALAARGWHVCDHGIYTRHPTANSKRNRRRADMNRIRRLQQQLSDRLWAEDDALAEQAGWTITKTAGRFGFGARVYRDPRFGQRQAEATRAAQSTGARR